MLQGLKHEISTKYDGSFKSIYTLMDKQSWRNEDYALELILEYFKRAISEKNYVLGKEDFNYFLSIGSKLYNKGKMPFEDFKKHISKIDESKEETNDVKND